MPINEAAIFGSSLVRLYFLTGTEKWLTRARAMWKHWKRSFALDPFGYITYPYAVGDIRNGWRSTDSISINSPEAPPVPAPETFHKAALTLQFMILLERASPGLLRNYLLEFRKLIIAAKGIGGTPIAEFPDVFGFNWPLNTFHAIPPFYNEGWIALMHDNEDFHASIHRYAKAREWSLLPGEAYSKLMRSNKSDVSLSTISAVIHPDLIEDATEDCAILEEKSSITELRFFNTSPKHNTLYLYVDKSSERRIRLDVDAVNGGFKAIMFVPAHRCIFLSWSPETNFSYPQTEDENQVFLTHVTIDEGD